MRKKYELWNTGLGRAESSALMTDAEAARLNGEIEARHGTPPPQLWREAGAAAHPGQSSATPGRVISYLGLAPGDEVLEDMGRARQRVYACPACGRPGVARVSAGDTVVSHVEQQFGGGRELLDFCKGVGAALALDIITAEGGKP